MFDLKPNERLFRIDWSYGLAGAEDSGAGSFYFAVSDAIPKGEEFNSLKGVIVNYYKNLPADKRGYDPNWGDAVNDVDFEGTGFRYLHMPLAHSFTVDHDDKVYDYEMDA